MALLITNDCINCDVCEPECPNDAIYMGEEIYQIDAKLCTECVGHFDTPQCQVVCPINCILPDAAHQESHNTLLERFKRIQLTQVLATPIPNDETLN